MRRGESEGSGSQNWLSKITGPEPGAIPVAPGAARWWVSLRPAQIHTSAVASLQGAQIPAGCGAEAVAAEPDHLFCLGNGLQEAWAGRGRGLEAGPGGEPSRLHGRCECFIVLFVLVGVRGGEVGDCLV